MEERMFIPVKMMKSTESNENPCGFLCGMSFCNIFKKEEECLRPVAMGAGCWDTGAPGEKAWEVRIQGDDFSLVHSLHRDIFKMGSDFFPP